MYDNVSIQSSVMERKQETKGSLKSSWEGECLTVNTLYPHSHPQESLEHTVLVPVGRVQHC